MSYCKKYNIRTTVVRCLACKECRPPGERVNGCMCDYEVDFDTLRAQAAINGMNVPESVRVISPEQIHENLYKYRFRHQLRDILSEMLDEYGEDPDRMKDSVIEKYEPMIYKRIIGEYVITAEVKINNPHLRDDTGTGK